MGGENGLFQYLVDIAHNSTWIETLQPYTKDLIVNYLMRGRDTKNSQHVKTLSRSLAKKITVFKTLTCTIAVKNDKVDDVKTFSEFVSIFYFKLLTLILTSEPTVEFRQSVLSLWDESMIQLFAIFKTCFPNNDNVPEIFAKVVIDEYFVGMPSIFKENVIDSLKEYLVSFASKAETSDLKPEISFKAAEDKPDSTVVSSNNVPQTPAPAPVPKTSGSTSSPVKSKPSATAAFDSSGEADIDNLLSNLNLNQFTKQFDGSRIGPDNDNPLKDTPLEWRETIKYDIRRQLGMVYKPPSKEYQQLIYRYHK